MSLLYWYTDIQNIYIHIVIPALKLPISDRWLDYYQHSHCPEEILCMSGFLYINATHNDLKRKKKKGFIGVWKFKQLQNVWIRSLSTQTITNMLALSPLGTTSTWVTYIFAGCCFCEWFIIFEHKKNNDSKITCRYMRKNCLQYINISSTSFNYNLFVHFLSTTAGSIDNFREYIR